MEWFLRGTEPISGDRKAPSHDERILYPPGGTVIALDPDIPPELQKILFHAQPARQGLKWILNGRFVASAGKAFAWNPMAGKFHLALIDEEDRVLDSVHFKVRGPGSDLAEEDP